MEKVMRAIMTASKVMRVQGKSLVLITMLTEEGTTSYEVETDNLSKVAGTMMGQLFQKSLEELGRAFRNLNEDTGD